MGGDDRPGSHRGTPEETPVSAVETVSGRHRGPDSDYGPWCDRGTRLSLARDLGVLALVGAPHAFALVVEPPEARFASVLLGWDVGAGAVRVERAVRGR